MYNRSAKSKYLCNNVQKAVVNMGISVGDGKRFILFDSFKTACYCNKSSLSNC